MQTINDRIEVLINDYCDGNKAAFAKSIGLPPTGLSNYTSKQRRSKPSIDMVAKIITKYNVDAKWLITGEETPTPAVRVDGDFSAASISGNVTNNVTAGGNDIALLNERIKALETLIAEKERTIKILLGDRPHDL